MYWADCLFPWVGSKKVFWLYCLFSFYCFLGVNIFSMVVVLMLICVLTPTLRRHRHQNARLEVFWGLIPMLLILLMMIPSIGLLYAGEVNLFPWSTVKVIGHQWYWEFEYPNIEWEDSLDSAPDSEFVYAVSCDSYPVAEEDLLPGDDRWSSTSSRLVLPAEAPVRMVCTSEDVVHNWNLKGSGTSADCVPGRLNQTRWLSEASGIFNGLCSELCGVGHSHMPCGAESLFYLDWLGWLSFSSAPMI